MKSKILFKAKSMQEIFDVKLNFIFVTGLLAQLALRWLTCGDLKLFPASRECARLPSVVEGRPVAATSCCY